MMDNILHLTWVGHMKRITAIEDVKKVLQSEMTWDTINKQIRYISINFLEGMVLMWFAGNNSLKTG